MVSACAFLFCLLSGNALPKLMGVDGQYHEPVRECKGQPTVFIFVAHDCPIANAYSPEFARIKSRYGKSVSFNLVFAEPDLSTSQAIKHARAFSLASWHLFIDPSGRFASACRAKISPQAAVFDAMGEQVYSGRIDDRYISFGQQRNTATVHDLRDAINAILSHKKPKAAAGSPVGCFIVQT